MRPSDKVLAATIAAAVGTIAFWLLHTYLQIDVPDAVQAAAVGLLTLAVGYVVPEGHVPPSAVDTILGD